MQKVVAIGALAAGVLANSLDHDLTAGQSFSLNVTI
jgi:hypothetical protein